METVETLLCRGCSETKTLSEFAPYAIKYKRRCRDCEKRRMEKCRGELGCARRLLFNLKERARKSQVKEVRFWTTRDVQTLLDAWEPSEDAMHAIQERKKLRLRVVRVDANKPFLPSNAEIEVVGVEI